MKNYDSMLDSISDLISKYNVGEDKTRFSIVTFADKAKVRVSLDDLKYQSQEALQQLLQDMKDNDKLRSRTRIDKALKMVSDTVFIEKNGDRPESPNIMIIFTEGSTNDASEPYDTVMPALEVRTYSVKNRNCKCLSNRLIILYPRSDWLPKLGGMCAIPHLKQNRFMAFLFA